jgi:2-polyprenyl-3-methyl-5-hydroxy-6-metoxy-1,4-benzoquinol methylase
MPPVHTHSEFARTARTRFHDHDGLEQLTGLDRVSRIRSAYMNAIESARPTPAQTAWRIGRFDRGMRLMTEISGHVGPIRDRHLLDLGAAHGGDACAAIALGMSVTMADFRDHDYATLEHAMQPFGRMDHALFDFNDDWPLPDAACDGLIAMAVLEHVHSLHAFFAQVARVLRPGGFAAIQTAMALPAWRRDGLFGTPGTALLPMRFRRHVAERWLGRRYSCPLADRTYYTSRPILRAAARHGLSGSPHKFENSPAMARVGRWPAAGFWRSMLQQTCTDYILLIQPPAAA